MSNDLALFWLENIKMIKHCFGQKKQFIIKHCLTSTCVQTTHHFSKKDSISYQYIDQTQRKCLCNCPSSSSSSTYIQAHILVVKRGWNIVSCGESESAAVLRISKKQFGQDMLATPCVTLSWYHKSKPLIGEVK